MNCMNCSNADSETIASNVDSSRRNSNARSKSLRNDEKYVANIINLLIQTLTLKKEKNRNHSWKKYQWSWCNIFKMIQKKKTIKIRMCSLQKMYRNWRYLYNCLASSYRLKIACKHKIACASHWKSHHEWTWQEKK